MNDDPRSFLLPDLGEGLTEAEILRWLVDVGDTVAVDQPVAEVETAKSAVELPSPYAGRVVELHGAPGDTIAVGSPLISVRSEGAGTATEPTPETGLSESAPTDGSPTSDAVLVGYGARRPRSSASSAREHASPKSGLGTTTSPGPFPGVGDGDRPRTPVVSPLVRRMAREHGIDVDALRGTGEGGLVLRRDVEAAISYRRGLDAARVPNLSGGPDRSRAGAVERVPLRGPRRAVAEQVTRSRREIPEATVWVDADATELLSARRELNAADPDRPVSLLALLSRFCLAGLRRFPALNSRVDTERAEIVRFGHVHLGFAAQTPRGLLVPVVRDADRLTTRELSTALAELTSEARAGTLPPDRLTAGTFTVNNYGVFGVDGSAAIIHHPQVAILGMGRVVRRPWVVGDADDERLEIRHVTELTLTFDHRACDGEEAAGFLRFVADRVERPRLVLGDL